MNELNYANEWEVTYYQAHGKTPSTKSMRIARHNDEVGNLLREQGISDARKGLEAIPVADFFKLAQRAFQTVPGIPLEFIQTVADAWRSDYLEGYEKGGAK